MGGEERRERLIGWFYGGALLIWCGWLLFEISCHGRNELISVVASFVLFQTSNIILRVLFVDPIFVNTSVSLLHSSLSSAFVLFILIKQLRSHGLLLLFQHDELVFHTWPFSYFTLCLSTGYFAYDQLDMLLFRLYSGSFPSILAHHFVLLLCFSLSLLLRLSINYLILTLFCEFHSVFLHLRKLRRMSSFRNPPLPVLKLEWLLNWFSFIIARLIPHALILLKLFRDSPKFHDAFQLPLACFGMFAMNALNIGLAFDLFAAYKRDTRPHPHPHPHTH